VWSWQVFVEYADTMSSAKAKQALHGRKFGGNAVVATFYREERFHSGDYSG
jgi:splicing factor U2AF subunit